MTQPASDANPALPPADAGDATPSTADSAPSWWQDVRVLWFLVACFCFVSMYRGLWDADESRYAQIPREMLVHHTWLIPTLDGFTYLEKPPLAYWPTELLYAVFGVHAWVARLVPGLFFLGTLTLVYDFCRRFLGREIAYAAAGMLLFQPLFGFLGLMVLTDGPLTFWLTLALVSVGRLRLSAQPSRWWAGVFWLGCLGAFFTKALVGLAFPIGIFVLDLIIRGNVRQLARMAISLVLGGLFTFAVCGQWLYSMSAQVPGFLHYFFITQHWDRFTGHQHGGNWFLFLIALPAIAWPWWPLVMPGLKNVWRSLRGARQPAAPATSAAGSAGAGELPAHAAVRGFLFLWFVAMFGFFSLSRGQLITYFLPAVPPLAMLFSVEFHTAGPALQRRCVMFAWKFGWVIVAANVALLLSIGNADKLKVEMTSGPISAVVGGVLLILANLLFYLLMGHRFLPRKPGRDPLMPYMLLLLATALGLGHATPNLSSAAVPQSEIVQRVAQADPQYLAVHWSAHVTESDRAAGLYFALDRDVMHIGRAVEPSPDGDSRCELMYCLGQTEPALAQRLLYPSWPAFRRAVLERPVGAGAAVGATRQVLLFVPRDREIELPADLGPVEPPQIVGRFLVYHRTTGRAPVAVPEPVAPPVVQP